jgi:PIN domain nuclease of toxin-antitoxin system
VRLLVDSEPLLEWLNGAHGMSQIALAAMMLPDNQVGVSAATVWEIERWRAEGRVEIPGEWLDHVAEPEFRTLTVTAEHAALAGALAAVGGDDVDRVIVAQAQLEGFAVVTRDPVFARFQVPTLPV